MVSREVPAISPLSVSGVVIRSLEREKLVNRPHGLRALRGKANLSAALQVARDVRDISAQPAHDSGPWHVTRRVDESRHGEIAARERCGDRSHMSANCGFAYRIPFLHLKHDPSAVRERLENVSRGVLIDSHRFLASLLESTEPGVCGLR
jgi:hypothetical protein